MFCKALDYRITYSKNYLIHTPLKHGRNYETCKYAIFGFCKKTAIVTKKTEMIRSCQKTISALFFIYI